MRYRYMPLAKTLVRRRRTHPITACGCPPSGRIDERANQLLYCALSGVCCYIGGADRIPRGCRRRPLMGNDARKALAHRYVKGLTMFERSGGTGILYPRYGLTDATSDTKPETLGHKSGCLDSQAG